jgi:hypothetical protein
MYSLNLIYSPHRSTGAVEAVPIHRHARCPIRRLDGTTGSGCTVRCWLMVDVAEVSEVRCLLAVTCPRCSSPTRVRVELMA